MVRPPLKCLLQPRNLPQERRGMISPMRPNLQQQKTNLLQTLLLQIRKRKKNANVLKNESCGEKKKPLDVRPEKSPKRKASSRKSEARKGKANRRITNNEFRRMEFPMPEVM